MHTVLVVENDHSNRVALRSLLEAQGWIVYSAGNGVEGLHILARIKPPCFILLDQKMPLLDGEGFLKAKNEHSEWNSSQVIVMSGYDDETSHLNVSLPGNFTPLVA